MPEPFNPNEHMMQIKSKQGSQDYLPVQWRLVWANEQCPELKITIVDKVIDPDREVEKEVSTWNNETRRSEKSLARGRGYAWFHVRVEDGHGKVGEAFKSETAIDFPDYAEKADTGATGRALAKIGYGTQFAGPEFDEQHRIVDAPVDRGSTTDTTPKPPASVTSSSTAVAPAQALQETAPATDQQLNSIRKLCQALGKPEPEQGDVEKMTYTEAKELITRLSHEYNENKQARKANPGPRMITPELKKALILLAAQVNENSNDLDSLTYEQAVQKKEEWTKAYNDQKAKGRYQEKKPASITPPTATTPDPRVQIIKELSTKIGRFERVEFSKDSEITIRPEDDITKWEWSRVTIGQARDRLTVYYNSPECHAWRAIPSKANNPVQWDHLKGLITKLGKETVGSVRKLDSEMTTLTQDQLTQGMVDRLIGYLETGDINGETGEFKVMIPDVYRIKKAA